MPYKYQRPAKWYLNTADDEFWLGTAVNVRSQSIRCYGSKSKVNLKNITVTIYLKFENQKINYTFFFPSSDHTSDFFLNWMTLIEVLWVPCFWTLISLHRLPHPSINNTIYAEIFLALRLLHFYKNSSTKYYFIFFKDLKEIVNPK